MRKKKENRTATNNTNHDQQPHHTIPALTPPKSTRPVKMMRTAALLVLTFAVVATAKPVELTKENFDSATAGKNSFVKFLAPW